MKRVAEGTVNDALCSRRSQKKRRQDQRRHINSLDTHFTQDFYQDFLKQLGDSKEIFRFLHERAKGSFSVIQLYGDILEARVSYLNCL